ncbi:pseudouridine synthase [Bradyrhizobium sp. STM 3562]|uniref:pseudouridine synthase n=1 Tax=Bradyrhizobium sp. STM 3562 TaxID=578924 RepID=UPI003890D6D1
MPRDKDKDNASWRGRRERPGGRKDRAEAARGGERKFAKRGFAGKPEDGRERGRGDRDERPFRRREERGERRDVRADRSERGRFREDGPRKRFDRRPDEAGDAKSWRKRDDRGREERSGGERGRGERPQSARGREARGSEDRPKFGRPRFERPRREQEGDRKGFTKRPGADRERKGDFKRRGPREARGGEERSRFARGRDQRGYDDRPKFDRPRFERPRRDNEEGREGFAKRPAFGGRGAYRERKPDAGKRPSREEARPKKVGERIAKVLARAGLASRRDAEEWVVQGRVSVNGRVINSPALDVTANDVIAVDGKPLPARERTRLFLYHKPRGLMTTHADPEGRPTVFDNLPEGLPRLISVGRLDFNTEGLLLLTNDGGLARVLELPETGWLRRYRVRAHGEISQAQLDELKNGIEVDGIKYGPIDATLDREQGANVWLVFAIREGKNREVRNVLAHLGLEVNRLIRISYGPFQLGEIAEGAVEEVKTRVLREQLGDKIIAQAGCDFAQTAPDRGGDEEREASPGQKQLRPAGKRAVIADRKGRRVLVQRTGSEEARARNELEARGYGPPRRPKRGYHGKRDFKPRDE